jgi:hypothetical protein
MAGFTGSNERAALRGLIGLAGIMRRYAMRESGNQTLIRDHYSALGWRLWRNNVGALVDNNGRPVRFGLANDTKALNETLKSGDLIGWRPLLVTPDMLGDCIAQFVSIECKPDGWAYRPAEPRAVAQNRWGSMIRREGGYAGFMIDPDEGVFYPPGGN